MQRIRKTVTCELKTKPIDSENNTIPSAMHFADDGQSASLAWCRAPFRADEQILRHRSDMTVFATWDAPSDEEAGLSFV
jgi:hypothetical protein